MLWVMQTLKITTVVVYVANHKQWTKVAIMVIRVDVVITVNRLHSLHVTSMMQVITPRVCACARGKVISLSVCCCRCCQYENGQFGWSRHLSDLLSEQICQNQQKTGLSMLWNCSAQAMSVTNSAFLPMPVDHTYSLGHVFFRHVHNWPSMIGTCNGRQQTLCSFSRCCTWDMCSIEL